MRRKQQIQALQQELALLRQTVDSGKELAALAADAAGQLRRPGLRTVAVQVMRSPRVRRAALIAGGMVAAVTLGAAAVHCRVYQAIVAQEVKKALKPASMRCRRPWTPWPRPRASRPTRRTRAKSTAADGTQKSSVSDRKRSFFYMVCVVSTCDQVRPNAAARPM